MGSPWLALLVIRACSSVGCRSFRIYPPPAAWAPPQAAVRVSAPQWLSPQAAGKHLLCCGILSLQGNLRSGAWSTSSPFFFSDLDVHKTVSHFFLRCLCSVLPCLLYIFPKVPPPWLLWWGHWSQLDTVCVWHGAAPASPHRGAPCCQHLAVDTQGITKH